MKWPDAIPSTHRIDGAMADAKNPYKLVSSVDDLQAFYCKPLSFGFAHGITIRTMQHTASPDARIVEVRMLTGNSWGHGRTIEKPESLFWMIASTEYFPTVAKAVAWLVKRRGADWPMTEDQLKLWEQTVANIEVVRRD